MTSTREPGQSQASADTLEAWWKTTQVTSAASVTVHSLNRELRKARAALRAANDAERVALLAYEAVPYSDAAAADGARSVYIKWWGHARQALLQAIRDAGADDLEVGGMFAAQYIGEGEVTTKGFNPPKLYKYEYRKPSATAGLLGGSPGVPPGQQATATVTTTAGTHTVPSPGSSQPAVPAVTSVPTVPSAPDPSAIAGARALIAQNLPDEVIRQAFPAISAELLAALRNAA